MRDGGRVGKRPSGRAGGGVATLLPTVGEAASAGACLITDAWEGLELFLAPGDEVHLGFAPENCRIVAR